MSAPARGLTLVAWLLAAGAGAGAVAQQPVFRAGVDYVQLDVVITDKNDKIVRGLTKADFVVTEHGVPQTLADFQFIDIPPVHRMVASVTQAAPTIDVVSNHHSPQGRQWVLVIDDLHIIELHLRQTRQVVQQFLESLPAEDQVAIVFVGRSDLSQGFTSDLGAQMRTVGRIKDALGFAYDAADRGGASVSSAPSEAVPKIPASASASTSTSTDAGGPLGDPAERERYRYALSTVDVLKNVSQSLVRSTYPRKALVYVSEGMTYSLSNAFSDGYLDFSLKVTHARDVLDQLKVVFESARRGGVPVYPIDPRGLPDCTAVRGDCVVDIGLLGNIQVQQQQMRTIAENTGGLAFVNNSDLPRAVRELVEDNSSFYVLGYYPQPFERDGKFHDVKVTVKRDGVRVRSRAGYEAPRAKVTTSGAEARTTLDDALAAALPSSGLTLRAFAAPVAAGLKGMKTAVTVQVTYPAPADGSKLDDQLHFGMVAVDGDGKIKGSVRREYRFTGSPKGVVEVTYAINDVIELPSQPLTLRLAVVSQALGTAGSIHIPVEPIDPSRDRLQLGAVVIGLAGPAREAAVPPGALDGLVPFQPTTVRTFVAADSLRVFVPVFWAGKDASADVTISVRRGPEAVLERHGRAGIEPPSSGNRRASFTETLPLAGLAPGAYLLHVEASQSGNRAVIREVAIEIR